MGGLRDSDLNANEETSLSSQSQSIKKDKKVEMYCSKAFLSNVLFVVIISTILIWNYFVTVQYEKDARFYREQILNYDLLDYWKTIAEEEQTKQKNSIQVPILILAGEHKITRAQLGKIGWTMLHMMSGAYPDNIDLILKDKFNAFMALFAQMYPCKLCAMHFTRLLKQFGPFIGNTKTQLMIYMCQLHNKVNEQLKKPLHSCENIKKQWNVCGCADSL